MIKAQAAAFDSSEPHDGVIQPDSENVMFNVYLLFVCPCDLEARSYSTPMESGHAHQCPYSDAAFSVTLADRLPWLTLTGLYQS